MRKGGLSQAANCRYDVKAIEKPAALFVQVRKACLYGAPRLELLYVRSHKGINIRLYCIGPCACLVLRYVYKGHELPLVFLQRFVCVLAAVANVRRDKRGIKALQALPQISFRRSPRFVPVQGKHKGFLCGLHFQGGY